MIVGSLLPIGRRKGLILGLLTILLLVLILVLGKGNFREGLIKYGTDLKERTLNHIVYFIIG